RWACPSIPGAQPSSRSTSARSWTWRAACWESMAPEPARPEPERDDELRDHAGAAGADRLGPLRARAGMSQRAGARDHRERERTRAAVEERVRARLDVDRPARVAGRARAGLQDARPRDRAARLPHRARSVPGHRLAVPAARMRGGLDRAARALCR